MSYQPPKQSQQVISNPLYPSHQPFWSSQYSQPPFNRQVPFVPPSYNQQPPPPQPYGQPSHQMLMFGQPHHFQPSQQLPQPQFQPSQQLPQPQFQPFDNNPNRELKEYVPHIPQNLEQSDSRSQEENYETFLYTLPKIPNAYPKKYKIPISYLYLYIGDGELDIMVINPTDKNFYSVNSIQFPLSNGGELIYPVSHKDFRPDVGNRILVNVDGSHMGYNNEYLFKIKQFELDSDKSDPIFVVIRSEKHNDFDMMIYQQDKFGQLHELTPRPDTQKAEFVGFKIVKHPQYYLFNVNDSIYDRIHFLIENEAPHEEGETPYTIDDEVWDKFHKWFY